ncbi:hypothetical protein TeGR_g257 [Tetraparma gracilis]|uniref:Uncharacterized protein n=1 Tax=Tetraparma gracilis TaxID=2962635 RepID=A0ABQ6MMJ0_9STRA|nr:hypothetical protein TeGR_g257 [Tetraparma gracilis]
MGAGASQAGNLQQVMGVLQAELQKPLDASDCQDLGYANNEVRRLRNNMAYFQQHMASENPEGLAMAADGIGQIAGGVGDGLGDAMGAVGDVGGGLVEGAGKLFGF